MLDRYQGYLDDFRDLRATAEQSGKTEDGMDTYLFKSDNASQPLFRVDDGIGDNTDPNSPMNSQDLGSTQLTAGDIAALQALYGSRAPDPHRRGVPRAGSGVPRATRRRPIDRLTRK